MTLLFKITSIVRRPSFRHVPEECGASHGFPPRVYRKTGAAEMLPQLLEILKPDDLRCVHVLRGGRVCVSFREKSVHDHHLAEGLRSG